MACGKSLALSLAGKVEPFNVTVPYGTAYLTHAARSGDKPPVQGTVNTFTGRIPNFYRVGVDMWACRYNSSFPAIVGGPYAGMKVHELLFLRYVPGTPSNRRFAGCGKHDYNLAYKPRHQAFEAMRDREFDDAKLVRKVFIDLDYGEVMSKALFEKAREMLGDRQHQCRNCIATGCSKTPDV